MSSQENPTQVMPLWGLAIPLPAVLMITVVLYMIVLGVGLWIRYCLKDRCSCDCGGCCPGISIYEQCFKLAEMCHCNMPTAKSCWKDCPPCPSCTCWNCPCSCQPPECDSCHCLCFEIRIK
ncbi:SCO-spondin [Notolabrus celidotus]|uniref:SCO-spondin n=1 Tax=Notolabrus celidotus TaxID=1203425 RepID=UPI00148FC593|nr:SCO-spondin [Notolabrus celidotus]XP_034566671.1 SCO-spondin [Notolabrus celidotus]